MEIHISVRQSSDERFHPADSSLEIQLSQFPTLTVHHALQRGLESPQIIWHIIAIPCKIGKSIIPDLPVAAVERNNFSAEEITVIDCADNINRTSPRLIEIWVVTILMTVQKNPRIFRGGGNMKISSYVSEYFGTGS